MTILKKSSLAIVACAALASTALAGYKFHANPPVLVTSSSGSGILGDARASANNIERIGCLTYGYAGSTSGYTFCSAVDAGYKNAACSSTNPSIVQAASAIGPASSITFRFDASGTCTSLDVQNFSEYTPMVP
jgi:hypothetical protein